MISIPTLSLLFLQNKQVQTAITEFITKKLANNLQVEISISEVQYSFLKRLQVYDFYMEDQNGDTLMYSEITKARIKKFRPDKNDIVFKKITFDNAFFSISVNEDRLSSIQFFVDSLRKDIPADEKVILRIDQVNFTDSRFRLQNVNVVPKESGIDFSDLNIRNVNIDAEDFLFRSDTTFIHFSKVSGVDASGFNLQNVGFDFTVGKKFMTFSQGWVITPLSEASVPVVDFKFSNPKNFRYLYDSIDLYISSSNSLLDFSDIAYFFPELKELQGMILLNGAIFGKFGDLKGENIFVDYLNETRLAFDMHLVGMPSQDSLYMDFEFREFNSTRKELKELTAFYNIGFLEDSLRYGALTHMYYQGSFKGFKTNFETRGTLNTNLGSIALDLNMKPDASKALKFNGNVESDRFLLGNFLNKEESVGSIDFNLHVDGTNADGNLEASVSGAIDSIGLYNYEYSNIQLEGTFSNKKFDGSFFIDDPNIDMIFAGSIDLGTAIPSYDFTLDVANLRPYYLHLRDDDPEYFASFYLKTKMTGKSIGTLNGNVQLVNSLFRRSGSQIQMYDIQLNTGNSADTSFISLSSDLIDAEIRGNYNLNKLPSTFLGILNDHFYIFPNQSSSIDTAHSFSFDMNLKDINPLLEFFFPRFSLTKNISVDGFFQPNGDQYLFTCNGFVPNFGFSDLSSNDLEFIVISDSSGLSAEVSSSQLSTKGGFEILNPTILADFSDNKNNVSVKWDNESEPRYAGDISTNGSISYSSNGKADYSLTIHPSYIYYDNRKFALPLSKLHFNSEGIAIDSFLITGSDQYILANGRYTDRINDSITLALENLNLHVINEISNSFLLDIEGFLSGNMSLKKEAGKAVFTSDLLAENLIMNDQTIGNTSILTEWNRLDQQLEFNVFSMQDSINQILSAGFYKPENEVIDIDFSLSKIKLAAFQPFFDGKIEGIDGSADIKISIDGTLKNPTTNGSILFRNASATVNQTKATYFFSDRIRLYKNDFYFDDFKVLDRFDNSMTIGGNISTSNFKNVFLNLDFNANNFNFLATSRFDNEQFYGDIYASANAKLNGPIKQLGIVISANTEKYTNLKLPLYNATQIQNSDYITFIKTNDPDDSSPIEKTIQKNSFTLDMDLEITSQANVQLIFDPKVGDIIEASGKGNLKLEIDDNGEFSMFGDVLIQDGEYLFTLQNVINKRFRVKQGGTIAWNGSPTSANVNMEAIYETKASVYSLSPDPTEAMKKRIPVYCLLSLQGELTNPTISPSIELPTAEPETRSLVETSIGTDEELMRQFISLLVINNFISSSEFGANPIVGMTSTGVAGVTASELLSNQLSNWLSQLSNDFDIGVNYRPGDAISSDEVEVALSTQLLNDRIIFSGNLDVLGDAVSTSPGEASNIVGDFDLEFKVSDKISLKAFNRVNDDRVVRPSLYTQGVGLLYRSEFNKVSEIFKRKRSDKKKKKDDKSSESKAALKEDEIEFQK